MFPQPNSDEVKEDFDTEIGQIKAKDKTVVIYQLHKSTHLGGITENI